MNEPPPFPPPPPPPPRPRGGSTVSRVLFSLSLMLNLLIVGAFCGGLYLFGGFSDDESTRPLTEHHRRGKKSAANKIAIVRIEGVLMEGMLRFAERQLEQAARDDKVKAVVLRINSPGGTITASDDLYQLILHLRDGDSEQQRPAKPLVVSMGSLAASGGYYIAVPGQVIYAERSTITGSIGVFAAFPNFKGLATKIGVSMDVIKKGDLKAAGSPFQEPKPQEEEMWQGMVDHAYRQFEQVIEDNRPQLKGKLEEIVTNEKRSTTVTLSDGKTEKRAFQYVRRCADGGVFTADRARELGLIDKVGYLDEAIKEARDLAALGDEYEAITYEAPFRLSELILGTKAAPPTLAIEPEGLAEAATPRLWYLAPQSELAGIFQAYRRR